MGCNAWDPRSGSLVQIKCVLSSITCCIPAKGHSKIILPNHLHICFSAKSEAKMKNSSCMPTSHCNSSVTQADKLSPIAGTTQLPTTLILCVTFRNYTIFCSSLSVSRESLYSHMADHIQQGGKSIHTI